MIDKKEAMKLLKELQERFRSSSENDSMDKLSKLNGYITMLESNQKLLEETIENLVRDIDDDYGVDGL